MEIEIKISQSSNPKMCKTTFVTEPGISVNTAIDQLEKFTKSLANALYDYLALNGLTYANHTSPEMQELILTATFENLKKEYDAK